MQRNRIGAGRERALWFGFIDLLRGLSYLRGTISCVCCSCILSYFLFLHGIEVLIFVFGFFDLCFVGLCFGAWVCMSLEW